MNEEESNQEGTVDEKELLLLEKSEIAKASIFPA